MPSGNAQRVQMMTLYPQSCIITGYPNSADQKPALDLGFEIEQYGHVYVSELGMAWLARQFGHVDPEKAQERIEFLEKELAETYERINELELSVARIPEAVEGILDGLKQLSINSVNDLLGIVSPSIDGDDSIPAGEGEQETPERPRPVIKATRRNNTPSS
jgi:hypothetical protein